MRAMPSCRRAHALAALALLLVLAGCASQRPAPAPSTPPAPPPEPVAPPPPPAPPPPRSALPHFRCDNDLAFSARFGDGSVDLDLGERGTETLLRDAGGTTPQQAVYSSTSMKAEFDGDQATLRFVSPPVTAHCTRD